MKIFVSSRMRELFIERKTAVEAIHFSGHTPLYIETEPEKKDNGTKETMDQLISGADGFLSIFYLSSGKKRPILDNYTPIQYELLQFCKVHHDRPVLFFRQKPDRFVKPSKEMLAWFRKQAKIRKSKIITFESQNDFNKKLREELLKFKIGKDEINNRKTYIVRYSGPDYRGLIAKISEIIFTWYKLNIDYISHASQGDLATVYITCSTSNLSSNKIGINTESFREQICDATQRDFSIQCPDMENKWTIPFVQVNTDNTPRYTFQFYLELRAISAPGQINAISRILRDSKFNIEELQQKPTPPEYKKQAAISIWLTKKEWLQEIDDDHIEADLRDLEIKIRYLIGIQAFSIRIVRFI
jgi:hypothetical protein